MFCAAISSAEPTYYDPTDQAAFDALFANRQAALWSNDSEDPVVQIAAPDATLTQVDPVAPSLLDSDVGFVWRADAANPTLGVLEIEFARPVVAAGFSYNWIPGADLTMSPGLLGFQDGGSIVFLDTFGEGDRPFKSGWIGVADPMQPFQSVQLRVARLAGDYAFYFFDTAARGALEFVPAPALSGDYDSDGDVDSADYVVWRSRYGEASAPAAGADGNADGLVNAADYTVWRDALAEAPNTASVPEPAALVTALPLLLAGLRRR
ncbi:hypothetical protein Pla108_21870 [Botrimarina colliarenosi]|uniref:Dockerin domain-containing protein n=2 Tax=Botrimarina colliarenosi TaxID=2528001 RepID=A0A5C6AD93_9BACT|nr:hypothetical protein Pla108_21870 [Botrimarina colliarenosi]